MSVKHYQPKKEGDPEQILRLVEALEQSANETFTRAAAENSGPEAASCCVNLLQKVAFPLHIDGLGQLSSIGRALAWHAGDGLATSQHGTA